MIKQVRIIGAIVGAIVGLILFLIPYIASFEQSKATNSMSAILSQQIEATRAAQNEQDGIDTIEWATEQAVRQLATAYVVAHTWEAQQAHSIRQTAVAISATQQAQSIASATAWQVTEQARATVGAATGTHEALRVHQTQSAIQAQATRDGIANNGTATAVAHLGLLDHQLIQAEETAVAYRHQQLQLSIERNMRINRILDWLPIVMMVLLILCGVGIYVYMWRRDTPQVFRDPNGQLTILTSSNYRMVRPHQTRSTKMVDAFPEEVSDLPQDARWQSLNSWRGQQLPLGISQNGLLLADPENNPHWLIAGTTRSGKTRHGLRPLITFALSDSWQCAILVRPNPDFLVFENHPNVSEYLLDSTEQAIVYLESTYKEVKRRMELLREHRHSTWGYFLNQNPTSPDRRLLIVVDEFSNLADEATSPAERKDLWRWARMIAAEGGKTGVHLAIALQDPSYRSMDLRIRRNCTPICFKVKDMDASRVVLNTTGAERLPPNQFFTYINGLQKAVAFTPSDNDIRTFLQQHPVPTYPELHWLRQAVTTINQTPPTNGQTERIRQLTRQGLSMREVQRQVFGYTGGAAYEAVKPIYDQVRV